MAIVNRNRKFRSFGRENNAYQPDQEGSSKVFEFRREKRLDEAYSLAVKLYRGDPDDEWVQKAYAWVLIDLIKAELGKNESVARNHFNTLVSIRVDDDIVKKQIGFLRPKLTPHYHEVNEADNLSKSGKHEAALQKFRHLKSNKTLPVACEENYGWTLYRYLKEEKPNLQLQQVKSRFYEYLQLRNPRPSLLHSLILGLAISYAKELREINMLSFLNLWKPHHLRSEDFEKTYNDSKSYPSLVERLIRRIAEDNRELDVEHLCTAIGAHNLVLDTVRETWFWKFFNLKKGGNARDVESELTFYLENYSCYGPSHWHSEILRFAENLFDEKAHEKFLNFLQSWGIDNYCEEDWESKPLDDGEIPSLVHRCCKRVYEFAKENRDRDYSWLLPLFEEAADKDGDTWSTRRYATLLDIAGKKAEAVGLFKRLVLDLNDQSYIWSELAAVLEEADGDMAVAMFCKAIVLQKKEDFLGEVRLQLANLLIAKGELGKAKTEISTYSENRLKNEWKFSNDYKVLENKLALVDADDMGTFYKEQAQIAENYVYRDIPWKDCLLFDSWTNKEGQQMSAFTDMGDVEFIVKTKKYPLLAGGAKFDVYQFKLHFHADDDKYLVLQLQDAEGVGKDFLQDATTDVAIIDHVNPDKKVFHCVFDRATDAVIQFAQFDSTPKEGEFVEVRYFSTCNKKKYHKKTHILEVRPTDQVKESLQKVISGELCLKYKGGRQGGTLEYEEALDPHSGVDASKPDFAFIDDFYVHRKILRENGIIKNMYVTAKALFNGSKWSVYKVDKNVKSNY